MQHLIAAVPRLRDRHPGLRVVIAGDGPYRDELEAETRRLRLRRHGLLRRVPGRRRSCPALMAATDATVVPSIYEPFGMVALEARRGRRAARGRRHRRPRRDRRARRDRGDLPAQRPGRAGRRGRRLLSATRARPPGGPQGAHDGAERYGWATIAQRTAASYAAAIQHDAAFTAERAEQRMSQGRALPAMPEGNLLAAAGLR